MARYIAEMTREMSDVARARSLIALADVLLIAHHEAEMMTKVIVQGAEDSPLEMLHAPGRPT